jgi:hypothetical protein
VGEALAGDLAPYEKVSLFQHSVTPKTTYRYRGCLLHYQEALPGNPPTVKASKMFLAHLREQSYKFSSNRILD